MSFFSEEKSEEFSRAAADGDLQLVQTLSLDPEVNLDWINDIDQTPFAFACRYNHVDVVRYLLNFEQRTIDYNFGGNDRMTPFFWACYCGHEAIVNLLLADERIDVNKADTDEETPLWYAVQMGNWRTVKLMLASGRPIDTRKRAIGNEKTTAAETTTRKGNDDIAALINLFERDPQEARVEIRRAFGLDGK
jgi:ankyrin repeat protein